MDYDDLKAAREKGGRSLEEIAERTKIPIRHLRALEEGRLRYWPRGLYVRSYAQAYAEAARLDPAAVIAIATRLVEDLDRETTPALAEPMHSRWWQVMVVRGWLLGA